MKTTELDVGLRCIKYLLFAVNSLFVLTGIIAVAVGATIYQVYNDYPFFWGNAYFSPSVLLMIVGGIIFIIAFFGCCGAVRESTCMVLVFAVSLTLVLILEVSAVIVTYILKNDVVNAVVRGTEVAMHSYFDSPVAADKFLREELNCCRFTDQPPTNGTSADDKSCCTWLVYNENPRGSEYCSNTFGMNCYYALSDILDANAVYVFSSVMLISFVQLIGIMFACSLGRAIRRQKTDREMQRWQLGRTENYQSIRK